MYTNFESESILKRLWQVIVEMRPYNLVYKIAVKNGSKLREQSSPCGIE